MSVKNIEDIEASIGSESLTTMKNRLWSIVKSSFLCCFGYCGIVYLCRWYKLFKDKKLKKQLENNGSGDRIQIKGLNNLGNTCFFNSMLQCVIHTVPLHNRLSRIIAGMDYIVESNIGGPMQVKGPARTGQFTMTLQQFLCEVNTRQDGIISPCNVLNALSRENTRFAHRTQEDSHEALRCLLSALRNDEITGIKAAIYNCYGVTADPASHSDLDGESKLCMKEYLVSASKGAAVVDQLIGTTLISTTICHQCRTPGQIVELCLDLSLPMSSCEDDKLHMSCVDDQNKGKKKSKKKKKKHSSIKKEHIMTATPCANDLPVNTMPDESNFTTKNTNTDNSTDEEPTEFLNGYFDATIMYLFTHHDDPSSSEEEQSDNENVPVKDHSDGETLKSNVMINHSTQLNTRKHNGSIEVLSVEDTEIDSDEEEHVENNIVFSNYELNLYLKDKGFLCQVPLYNKPSVLTLEQCLLEFTGLDVLDEDNKFICQACTNSKLRSTSVC